MAKKGGKSSSKSKKKGKKGKKGKKSKNVDISQDPNFKMGEGEFLFENGDRYEGSYCAHRSGLVWREGKGTYYTHDGHIYCGCWKDDKIDEHEPIEIFYNNQDNFCGTLSKFKYSGPGMYLFKSGDYLSATFDKNQPSGCAILVDHRGDCWYGCTEEKDRLLLFREHAFYSELHPESGKGLPKHPPPVEFTPSTETTHTKSLSSTELKQKVFAKSTKTFMDVDFDLGGSEWYEDSLYYDQMECDVLPKIQQFGLDFLTDEELTWYVHYVQNGKVLERRKQQNQSVPVTNELLLRFLSDEYRNSCPGVRVIYPRDRISEETIEEEDEGLC